MELLELKSTWDVIVEDTAAKNFVDDFLVSKSIRKGSKMALAKIKRVMYMKFFLGGASLIYCMVFIVGSYVDPDQFSFLEGIMSLSDNRLLLASAALFLASMLSWNYLAFKEIKQFETKANDLKRSLRKFTKILSRTIKLNIYFGTLFNALAVGWVFYLADNKFAFLEGKGVILIATLGVVVSSAVFFFFLNRYDQKVKFGNHLEALKEDLEDLEKEK